MTLLPSREGTCSILAALAFWGMALTGTVSAQEPPGDATPDQIAVLREHLSAYLDLERTIAEERADWKLAEVMLRDRIAFLKDQVDDLKEKTKEAEGSISESDKEREKLSADAEAMEAANTLTKERIRQLEGRLQAMQTTLPQPLLDKVAPLLERLPKPDTKEEDIRASVSQRYVNALVILNEINKFHADIAAVPERRDISGGRKAEVQTIYLGLSQAFYAGTGETAKEVGRGISTPGGWEWTPLPDNVDEAGRLLRILSSDEAAAFVPMPVVTDGEGSTAKEEKEAGQ